MKNYYLKNCVMKKKDFASSVIRFDFNIQWYNVVAQKLTERSIDIDACETICDEEEEVRGRTKNQMMCSANTKSVTTPIWSVANKSIKTADNRSGKADTVQCTFYNAVSIVAKSIWLTTHASNNVLTASQRDQKIYYLEGERPPTRKSTHAFYHLS